MAGVLARPPKRMMRPVQRIRHTQRIEPLRTVYFGAFCELRTLWLPLRIAYCVLYIRENTLLSLSPTLRIAYCVLRIAYCVLPGERIPDSSARDNIRTYLLLLLLMLNANLNINLIVVHQSFCCSVVTVNNKNTLFSPNVWKL